MKFKQILPIVVLAGLTALFSFKVWRQLDSNPPIVAASVANASTPPQEASAALWNALLLNVKNDQPQSLAAFKGQIVVVNFWASWCGPCVEEMPLLAQLHDQYANKGVQFIGIGVDSEKNVKAFLEKVPITYPIYISGFGGTELARNLGNTAGALPFTAVIDTQGKVRLTKLGPIQPAELQKTLDALIN